MKIDLWKDPKKKVVEPNLFSGAAEELARKLADDNKSNKKANKRTQIRKFYDEVLSLDAEAQANPDETRWQVILPQLHLLIAKAAYAKGRELVSDNFLTFIKDTINGQVKTPDDLKIFATFFEAFMGFYRLHGPSN